jgi:GNAT superfamily N-acetyltransferase
VTDFSAGPFIFRHYSLEPDRDFYRLARLLQQVEDYDQDGEDVSEPALLASLEWHGHDPQKDRWLAFDRDHLDEAIGYAIIFTQSPQRATLHVAVRPDWRRRGLGQALFQRSLERARHLGVRQILSNTNAKNTAAVAFLQHQGFQLAGEAWSLHLPAGRPVAVPEWPAGCTARRYVESPDLSLLAGLLNRCYADRWGHTENIPEAVDEARVARSEYCVRRISSSPLCLALARRCQNRPAYGPAEDHLLGAPGLTRLTVAGVMTAPDAHRSALAPPPRPASHPAESYGDEQYVIAIYQSWASTWIRYLSYLYDLK